MTFTTEQAGVLAQIFLVMIVATALSTRLEGRADKKERRVLYMYYAPAILAVVVNLTVYIFNLKPLPGSLAASSLVSINALAAFFALIMLILHTALAIHGVREPINESEATETLKAVEEVPSQHQADKPVWVFHLEYRGNARNKRHRDNARKKG